MDWKKNIKCLIFDLDGVIVDTAIYHYLAWKNLAISLGIDFSESDNENLKGISRMDSLEFILNLGGIAMSHEDKLKLAASKNFNYLELIKDLNESNILPGVINWLNQCEQYGIKIALGSASKNARGILEAIKLMDRFHVIIDGTNTSKTKPDPEVFLLAAEKLNLKPQECVVIEDSFKGIEAAQNGNFYSIGIGDKSILYNATIHLADMSENDINILSKLK